MILVSPVAERAAWGRAIIERIQAAAAVEKAAEGGAAGCAGGGVVVS